MGKSNKKVKNERINAMRKQYDAFLEEDKKRRERNEYILGKLDKMRSSTALVPLSTKANYRMEINTADIFMRPNIRTKLEMRDCYVPHLDRQSSSPSIIDKSVDEMRILKEISKKYILIPKRTVIINDDVYSNDGIDEDWKSKYNILDDLKKQEKEGYSDSLYSQDNNDGNMRNKKLNLSMDSNNTDKDHPNFDKPVLNKNNKIPTTNTSHNSLDKQEEVKQVLFDVPEIDNQDFKINKIPSRIASSHSTEAVDVDQTQVVHNAIQETINPQENDTIKEKYNLENNEKHSDLINNFNINSHTLETANDSIVHQEKMKSSDNDSTAKTNQYIASENNNAYITTAAVSNENSQETGNVEYSEETPHREQDTDNKKDTSDIRDLNTTKEVKVHDDKDSNTQAQIVTNEPTIDKIHHEPSQNTIPIDLEDTQHLEHIEHESEINAFETEQKEMFYSEQGHADNYVYNEGEGNTGEYPVGYEQNDQYAYHEGVQQEQAYATNINEHEESTERYDPHYNQQYEGSYENQQSENPVDYENTNTYEQQEYQGENQQFQDISNYEHQQDNAHLYQQEIANNENEVQENEIPLQVDQTYDQHLYAEQPDTQDYIEQQLITEEGYIESSPVIADALQKENEGEIENAIDINTPEESILEPKLS